MRMPDGSIKPKQPLSQGQQQQPAQAQPQAAVDTGANQNVAANASTPSDSDVNIPPGVADSVLANANAQPATNAQGADSSAQPAPVQLAAVSPMAAGQNYLNALGLGAGAGQLYPADDLYG